jgi:hypothetical protein
VLIGLCVDVEAFLNAARGMIVVREKTKETWCPYVSRVYKDFVVGVLISTLKYYDQTYSTLPVAAIIQGIPSEE